MERKGAESERSASYHRTKAVFLLEYHVLLDATGFDDDIEFVENIKKMFETLLSIIFITIGPLSLKLAYEDSFLCENRK